LVEICFIPVPFGNETWHTASVALGRFLYNRGQESRQQFLSGDGRHGQKREYEDEDDFGTRANFEAARQFERNAAPSLPPQLPARPRSPIVLVLELVLVLAFLEIGCHPKMVLI
jgi:hypothetical protein